MFVLFSNLYNKTLGFFGLHRKFLSNNSLHYCTLLNEYCPLWIVLYERFLKLFMNECWWLKNKFDIFFHYILIAKVQSIIYRLWGRLLPTYHILTMMILKRRYVITNRGSLLFLREITTYECFPNAACRFWSMNDFIIDIVSATKTSETYENYMAILEVCWSFSHKKNVPLINE